MKLIRGCLLLVMLANGISQAAWVNATANLAGHASACGNVFCLVAVPGQDKIITGISGNQGLFATTDNGATWAPMGASTGWVDAMNIVFDKDNPEVFWEIGIHGGSTHKTADGGKTFAIIAGAGGGDGIGIDMTDPQRRTLLIGAHEGTNLNRSLDGGATWKTVSAGISGWTNYPIVIEAQTYICGSQNSGIYRTTNGGDSWTKVSALQPGWDPLLASNGDIYFAANGNQAILKSSDKGLTWTSIAKPGSGNGWYTPIEMPDGSLVAIGQNALVQCKDGKTWTTLGSAFPTGVPATQGNIAYNPVTRTFFIAFWDCTNAVPANSIWKEAYAGTPIIRKIEGARKPKNRAAFDVYGRRVEFGVRTGAGVTIVKL